MKKKKYSSDLLGQIVYIVDKNKLKITEEIVNNVSSFLDKDDTYTYTNEDNYHYRYYYYKEFFSLKKAENYLKSLTDKKELQDLKDKHKKEYDKVLAQKIKDFENILPKKVIIRTSRSKNEWKTFERGELFILNKYSSHRNTIGFHSNGNIYSFENEDKNWKWFTEYDELLIKKENLIKQLEELQIKIDYLVSQHKDKKLSFRKELPKSTRKFVVLDTNATVGDFETKFDTPLELLEEIDKGTSFINLFIVDYLGEEEMIREAVTVEQLRFMTRRQK